LEGRNATNKSCLFYAKFFEFEEFSLPPFFLGSILPQHAVTRINVHADPMCNFIT
jgi:hypothetical protein